MIWNLINLGYADKDFSESERNVIDFLAEHWKINEQLLLEMLDIADTMLALTKQKDWIKTTSKPYDSIREVVEEADRDMEKLKKSIELTLKNACKEVQLRQESIRTRQMIQIQGQRILLKEQQGK